MYEGPECRLTVDFLNEYLNNQVITNWVFVGGPYLEKYPEGFDVFLQELPLVIDKIEVKGMFIYFTLHNEMYKEFYILHKIKSGRWQKRMEVYDSILYIEIEGKEPLWFIDAMDKASFVFTDDQGVLDRCLGQLGMDIFSPDFSYMFWKDLLKEEPGGTNITVFLSNQDRICGVGDYITSEVLYYAGISPHRTISTLTQEEREKLYEGLKVIPRSSYSYNGYNFMNEYGMQGSYKLKVYHKQSANRIRTKNNRMTYWYPDKQK